MNQAEQEQHLNRSDLWKIYRKQLFIRSCLNFERQQNLGFANAMSPVIEKFHENEEDKKDAYQRHMQLFLANPMTSSLPLGVAAAMEERYATKQDIDKESINAIKVALMSPLAALGDSLISGTIRPLVAGVACSLALSGSILGPIMFLIVMSIVTLGVRYYGVFQGYSKGVTLVDDLQKSGLIERLTSIAGIAAFVVIGGFIPQIVELTTKISFSTEDETISVQEQLDDLIPGILPLAITLLMFYLIKKKNVSPVLLMVLLMVIGVAGVYLGIF